jgi:hypothetical protein
LLNLNNPIFVWLFYADMNFDLGDDATDFFFFFYFFLFFFFYLIEGKGYVERLVPLLIRTDEKMVNSNIEKLVNFSTL